MYCAVLISSPKALKLMEESILEMTPKIGSLQFSTKVIYKKNLI
jgi:hypothetical protein